MNKVQVYSPLTQPEEVVSGFPAIVLRAGPNVVGFLHRPMNNNEDSKLEITPDFDKAEFFSSRMEIETNLKGISIKEYIESLMKEGDDDGLRDDTQNQRWSVVMVATIKRLTFLEFDEIYTSQEGEK